MQHQAQLLFGWCASKVLGPQNQPGKHQRGRACMREERGERHQGHRPAAAPARLPGPPWRTCRPARCGGWPPASQRGSCCHPAHCSTGGGGVQTGCGEPHRRGRHARRQASKLGGCASRQSKQGEQQGPAAAKGGQPASHLGKDLVVHQLPHQPHQRPVDTGYHADAQVERAVAVLRAAARAPVGGGGQPGRGGTGKSGTCKRCQGPWLFSADGKGGRVGRTL